MSKSLNIYTVVSSVGKEQFQCKLDLLEKVYTLEISRIKDVDKKGEYTLDKPLYTQELYFKLSRRQVRETLFFVASKKEEKKS